MKEQIIVRWRGKGIPAKTLRELRRIFRVSEAEKYAILPVDLPEAADAKFLAMLETELDHRIQFLAEA